MQTELIKIDPDNVDLGKIRQAGDIIKSGALVAFPTETVYGLGANGLDADAVARIFVAKGRPSDNPLILHISKLEQLYPLVSEITETAKLLMEKFFPGPLTLVFKKSKIVPLITTGGMDTVAIRMPSNPIARALIDSAGVPIAAPSANLSGKPSPTTAEHVFQDMDGRIDMIIDGGPSDVGLESTVVDTTTNPITLLRPGKVTLDDLRSVVGAVSLHTVVRKGSSEEMVEARSPGMKYRHYAPNAKVILIEGQYNAVNLKIVELIEKYRGVGCKVGVITTDESSEFDVDVTKCVGRDASAFGRNIFRVLRELDDEGVDIILSEGLEDIGLGLAVMNRLRKAASEIIVV